MRQRPNGQAQRTLTCWCSAAALWLYVRIVLLIVVDAPLAIEDLLNVSNRGPESSEGFLFFESLILAVDAVP